jgi:hypothetical protein
MMRVRRRASQKPVLLLEKFSWLRFVFVAAAMSQLVSNSIMVMMTMRRCYLSTSVLALSSSSSSSSLAPRPNNHNKNKRVIAVIGGGASGIFAAIAAAEHILQQQAQQQAQQQSSHQPQQQQLQVIVLEGSQQTLKKVKISGGGRCNVMHDTSRFLTTRDLLTAGYPRGFRELNGIFSESSHQPQQGVTQPNNSNVSNKKVKKMTAQLGGGGGFSPSQARAWFEKQPGVGMLKTEPDGRMFPRTDSSQTIIDALLQAAAATQRVDIYKNCLVQDISIMVPPEEESVVESSTGSSPRRFRIQIKDKRSDSCDDSHDDSASSPIQSKHGHRFSSRGLSNGRTVGPCHYPSRTILVYSANEVCD